MTALDSSVLVGIIKGEPDAERLLPLLASEAWVVGAPTLVETRAWCAINLPARVSRWLEAAIETEGVSVVPFGRDMADIAARAFAMFGEAGLHPARLNFGACMAYAVAVSLRAPLRFKGRDFGQTDVPAHPASIRM